MTTYQRTVGSDPGPQVHPPQRRVNRSIAGAALLVVVADLASKAAAYRWAKPHTEANVGIAGIVRPLRNPEFSLELFGTTPSRAVIVMAIVAMAGTVAAAHQAALGRLAPAVVGIGAGGALANTIDRAIGGGVADFLVIGPVVANLADAAVLVFVLAVLWRTLRPRGDRPTDPSGNGPNQILGTATPVHDS